MGLSFHFILYYFILYHFISNIHLLIARCRQLDTRRQSLRRLLGQYSLGGPRSLLRMDYGSDLLPSPVGDPREVSRKEPEPTANWISLFSSSMNLATCDLDLDLDLNLNQENGDEWMYEDVQTSRKIVRMMIGGCDE